ncbi:MAG: hypothetical protein ABI950_01495 [Solirubrobacteraceae bacterium]
MTRACCHSCQLRFTPAAAASVVACPICDQPLDRTARAGTLLGFRLHDAGDALPELPGVIAAALAAPPAEPR